MAIDSAAKRKAVAALSGAHWFGPGITPDATPDQFWRQASGYGYPGILAGAAAPVVDTQGLEVLFTVTTGRLMNN